MALLGIGTVFAALTVLVAALRLASRAVAAPEPQLARVRVPEPGPASRWVIAGRMRQTAPFLRRESGERWLPTR